MACDCTECVLDVLGPVFGDDAGNVAMEYTCFPMSCDVASKQARELLERVAAIGKGPALAEAAERIHREMDEALRALPSEQGPGTKGATNDE